MLKIDTHVHVDYQNRFYKSGGRRVNELVSGTTIQNTIERRGLDGAVVIIHSDKKNYKKDCKRVHNFYKNFINILPSVELDHSTIKCHVTYLAQVYGDDASYGSWYSHVTSGKGVFEFLTQYPNIDMGVKKNTRRLENLIRNEEISIIESTKPEHIDLLTHFGLTVLSGTDSYPNNSGRYGMKLGSRGIMIEGEVFNYDTFMNSLKHPETIKYFTTE